ncbi:MAG: sugar ABC transporter substrate-binding protein [Gemmatimonadetes bacterium]|nr:sugar ABC transporter substrate-binding protein [Gemmatimonadota bacterium]
MLPLATQGLVAARGLVTARGLFAAALLLAAVACSPETPAAVTLRVALWAGGNELEIEQRVADRYETLRPGTRVVLESAPNGYEERLLTSIAAGRPPDVYLLDSPDIPTFVDRGLAIDFEPYQEALGFRADSVFPQVLDAFRRGRSLFALPKDFTPMVLYANRGVLSPAGIDTPVHAQWTWDDFRRAARAATIDRDGDGRPDVYGFDFPRNLYQWVPFVWSAGGDILSPDGAAASGFMDGPAALDAYAFLTGLAEEGLTPGAQFVQQGDPAREARFASGGQAFLLSGHWTLPVFRDLVDAGELDLAIVRIPHHPSRSAATSVLYASGWAVPPNAANLRQAIDLAGFLASPEAQRIRARSGLAIPSRADVAAEFAARDTTGVEAAFISLVEGARVTWGAQVRDFSRVEALAVEIMDRRLLAGEDLASSAADVARRVDEVLRR